MKRILLGLLLVLPLLYACSKTDPAAPATTSFPSAVATDLKN
jgi:hypothetical protein